MKLTIFVMMLLLLFTRQAGKFIIIENANNKKPRSCIFAVPDPGLCFVGSLVNQSLCMAAVWARTKSPLSRAARSRVSTPPRRALRWSPPRREPRPGSSECFSVGLS